MRYLTIPIGTNLQTMSTNLQTMSTNLQTMSTNLQRLFIPAHVKNYLYNSGFLSLKLEICLITICTSLSISNGEILISFNFRCSCKS